MFALAVVLAVVAALLIACGAAVQERAAVQARPGRRGPIGLLLWLLHDARWVAGALVVSVGVGTHVVALTSGPVAAIQPVGSVGLLFAVGIKAMLDRTKVERLALIGCLAVIAGLATLLALLPHVPGRDALPLVDVGAAACCAVAVTGLALLLPGASARGPLRAAAVALGAGMCFGVAAAVVGVIGRRVVAGDVWTILSWPTLLVVVLLVCGGVAQQLAYRMAHFAVVYAVLLAADPITAGFAGVLILGEPMPSTPGKLIGLALGALVAVTGIAVLANARAANRSTAREEQACAS